MSGTVYVVLAIDTEGPASDPRLPDLLSTWDAIDARFLRTVFAPEYRLRYADSAGKPAIFSWFLLHWTGFTTNPVLRDFGYHRVYDHYVGVWGKELRRYGDGLYWHYHHPPKSGVGNEWNTNWLDNTEYENVLCRAILDRGFFPSVFRAGGTIETNETSCWLEQWIPFDYSNRAGDLNWDRIEVDGRRVREICDWSRAPSEWRPYRPDWGDYRRPGSMKRTIFRCLDILSGVHTLTQEEVDAAFARAQAGHYTVLSVFDHDFRDRAALIQELVLHRIGVAARRFREVTWRYTSALEAAQAVTGGGVRPGPVFTTHLTKAGMVISADRALFGPQPFVAVRRPDGHVERRTAQQLNHKLSWIDPVPIPDGSEIGIASSDECGNVGVARFRKTGDVLAAMCA